MDPYLRSASPAPKDTWLHFAAHGAATGAVALGVVGGIVGLVVGLFAYVPTAPFAVLEVGIPSAVAGGLLGAVAGAAVWLARSFRH